MKYKDLTGIYVIREPTIISKHKICFFSGLYSAAAPRKLPQAVKLCVVSGSSPFECRPGCSVPG